MSCSSAEARPAHRAACHLIVVFVALLLAALSTGIDVSRPSERAGIVELPEASLVHHASEAPATEAGHGPRGVFAAPSRQDEARSYHPAFETSDSAGALGFWMLLSLCGLLLVAALAPLAMQTLRGQSPRN